VFEAASTEFSEPALSCIARFNHSLPIGFQVFMMNLFIKAITPTKAKRLVNKNRRNCPILNRDKSGNAKKCRKMYCCLYKVQVIFSSQA